MGSQAPSGRLGPRAVGRVPRDRSYWAMTSPTGPCATTAPSSSMAASSQSVATASRSCDAYTTVSPFRRAACTAAKQLRLNLESPTPMISSTKRMSGSRLSEMEKARRRSIPLEYVLTCASSCPCTPANSMMSDIRRWAISRGTPKRSDTMNTFRRPLASASIIAVASSSTGDTRPRTTILPSVGGLKRARSFRSVVFPDPFAPRMPSERPASTVRDTSRSAVTVRGPPSASSSSSSSSSCMSSMSSPASSALRVSRSRAQVAATHERNRGRVEPPDSPVALPDALDDDRRLELVVRNDGRVHQGMKGVSRCGGRSPRGVGPGRGPPVAGSASTPTPPPRRPGSRDRGATDACA